MDGDWKDGLTGGVRPGRASGLNPGNRFEPLRLHVLGEHRDETLAEPGGQIATQVYRDRSKSVINRVQSPDIPFRWTLNPYRGCEHGCIYCYARPGHEYLGFSCGLDFEMRLLAKPDAALLLERELSAASWSGEPIVLSGVTDCYQPVERRLEITRDCLRVLGRFKQPYTIVTKNRLVLRDLDLIAPMARQGLARVAISLTTLDQELARTMEPRASSPGDRLAAMAELAGAGVPVTVMVAPIIPGLTDREIPQLLQAASEHSATSAGWVMLRLPHQVKELFIDWLERSRPEAAGRILAGIRQVRNGRLNESAFGRRMRGHGSRAEGIGHLFTIFARRYGLSVSQVMMGARSWAGPGKSKPSPVWDAPLFEAIQTTNLAKVGETGSAEPISDDVAKRTGKEGTMETMD
ncbi:MAG: PA0069 family radical SAM protein [Phycisphaeraceae bacterium]|nr:PA0069 family radical SAM protein [Phycisphaeraceae bacterium]